MIEHAQHLGFIVAAYATTASVLGATIAWILLDGRAQKRRLADLDRRTHGDDAGGEPG